MESIREKVSGILTRGRTQPWEEIRDQLNRTLRGWANYYAYGSPDRRFYAVVSHVRERVKNFLRRRHKLPRGTARFGHTEVYGALGVVNVNDLRRTKAFA